MPENQRKCKTFAVLKQNLALSIYKNRTLYQIIDIKRVVLKYDQNSI